MTYLVPVYSGDQAEFIGGNNEGAPPGVPGAFIVGFRGAGKVSAFRANATDEAKIVAPSNPNRRTITVKNEGSNDVFIGGEGVTTGNGYRLAAGDALTLELAGELWAVTAGTTDALYMIAEVDAPAGI